MTTSEQPEQDLPLTPLEAEVSDLRRRLDVLAERARIDAHAVSFLQGSHPVREGDCCLIDDHPTRFLIHAPPRRSHLRVQSSAEIRRLYTIEEVAEIVAKVRQEAPWRPSSEDMTSLVKGLEVAIYGHEERRTSTEDEGRWKILRDQLVGLVSSKEDR
jgi:hypothetical protein